MSAEKGVKMSAEKGPKYVYAQEHKLYYYYYQFTGHWENKNWKKMTTLVYFSGLKYLLAREFLNLARKMRHIFRQSDNSYNYRIVLSCRSVGLNKQRWHRKNRPSRMAVIGGLQTRSRRKPLGTDWRHQGVSAADQKRMRAYH